MTEAQEPVVYLLYRALANEWSAYYQYWHHYTLAPESRGSNIRDIFRELAKQEYVHARRLRERIVQLNGLSNPTKGQPIGCTWYPQDRQDLHGMVRADLAGERTAIEEYQNIMRVGADDATRDLLDAILLQETNHAGQLATFLLEQAPPLGKPSVLAFPDFALRSHQAGM